MVVDHYATLGIAPTATQATIRSAYLDLMRRYHPDRNPSPSAEARVREITTAYSVLRVPVERARYDLERVQRERATDTGGRGRSSSRSWRLAAYVVLIAGIAAILVVFRPLPASLPQRKAWVAAPEGPQARAPHEPTSVETYFSALCSSPATSDLVKRELFRQAAGLSGRDLAAFDRLGRYSRLLIHVPVAADDVTGSGIVECTATVTLDLPPKGATSHRARTFTGDLRYLLRTAEDAANPLVGLTTEKLMVQLLAELAQTSSQAVVDHSLGPTPKQTQQEPLPYWDKALQKDSGVDPESSAKD